MGRQRFEQAVFALQEQFYNHDWTLYSHDRDGATEKMYHWPGDEREDVMVVVHKSNGTQEEFHRHSFFFFNYTYKGYYDSLSQAYYNRITIQEGELYAGQPLAGHALFSHDNHDTIVIGVLIKQEQFYRYFLPLLPTNEKLFHFFLNPRTKQFSDEYIHFRPSASCELRSILEMMVVEYASGKPDTQTVLRSLAICYLSYLSREYSELTVERDTQQLSTLVGDYLHHRFDSATLTGMAQALGYHPSYLSSLIRKETGRTFSELLLHIRMDRALTLLKNTSLSVNDISLYLGYSNTSNFYKAFREFYHMNPTELKRADIPKNVSTDLV